MAQVIFVHEGDHIDYTPAGDLPAGRVIVQEQLVGVTTTPLTSGQVGSLAIAGIFDFPVEEPESWSVGELAYWDAVNQQCTTSTDNGANQLVGKVVQVDPRPGQGYVRVRLTP